MTPPAMIPTASLCASTPPPRPPPNSSPSPPSPPASQPSNPFRSGRAAAEPMTLLGAMRHHLREVPTRASSWPSPLSSSHSAFAVPLASYMTHRPAAAPTWGGGTWDHPQQQQQQHSRRAALRALLEEAAHDLQDSNLQDIRLQDGYGDSNDGDDRGLSAP
jgi:hypothetical protein